MQEKKKSISSSLARMTVIPILFLGIIVIIFGIFSVKSSLEKEVERELKSDVRQAINAFDLLYPGDYAVDSSDEELRVTKGDTILNSNFTLIDSLKESSEADITLFLSDIRILTTLISEDDVRLIGSKANNTIYQDVFVAQSSHFYKEVNVLGSRFYAYYEPIYNSNGTCVGMMAAVLPSRVVQGFIAKALLPLIALIILAAVFAVFWAIYFARDFKRTILRLTGAFQKVTEGTLSNTVAPDLLARKDEFGQMAHSVVDMQSSLRRLVDEDMLTGLTNRRSGQIRLNQLVEQTRGTSNHFCLALGDIDFFKKFNDTYGHDCGDLVLIEIAKLLQKQVKNYGVCSRWGGEEFLIIFNRGSFEEAKQVMLDLIDAVRNLKIEYEDLTLGVTMTFGLIDTKDLDTSDEMVKTVDQLLYIGKEHGRNRLVTKEDVPE